MSWMEWGGTKMKVNVDDVFAYNIELYVIENNEDHELKSIKGYKKRKISADGKRQFLWNQTCFAKLNFLDL